MGWRLPIHLQQRDGGHAVQPRMQRLERLALRQQHQQRVHAPARLLCQSSVQQFWNSRTP